MMWYTICQLSFGCYSLSRILASYDLLAILLEWLPCCLGFFKNKCNLMDISTYTAPLKFNMEPEKKSLEKEKRKLPKETIIFRFHVKFQGCIHSCFPSSTVSSTGPRCDHAFRKKKSSFGRPSMMFPSEIRIIWLGRGWTSSPTFINPYPYNWYISLRENPKNQANVGKIYQSRGWYGNKWSNMSIVSCT